MTLSELLHSVSFDEIMPFIGKYHGDENCMAGYKIHYDILCNTTPQMDEDSEKQVTISYYEPNEKEKNLPSVLLDASLLEGDLWEVSLAKELVIAPNVTATNAEIAACCIYHTSYYGFTEKDLHETFLDMTGDDEIENAVAAKRFKSLFGKLVPGKKQMSKSQDFHNALRKEMNFFRTYRLSKNEKKDKEFVFQWKRNWRKWKRRLIIEMYNKKVSEIGGFIEFMQKGESVVAAPTIKELSELFTAKKCNIRSYQTYINDVNKRFDNFKDLIVKYGAFKHYRLPCCYLCISSSHEFPLTTEEMQLVEIATKGCEDIRFCVKVNDDLGKEIEIRAAFYEKWK